MISSAILGLMLNEAAYMAEVIRGGFLAVPAGQRDAARALGLRPWVMLVKVTLPQVIRIILPAMGNSVNGLLKATSITSVISMEELMRRSETLMQVKFDVLEVFAAAAVYYLIPHHLVGPRAAPPGAPFRPRLRGRRTEGDRAIVIARLALKTATLPAHPRPLLVLLSFRVFRRDGRFRGRTDSPG